MLLSVKHSAPDRRAEVRGSPGETSLCALMAPGECKIRHECNILQVPIQNHTSGGIKAREPSPPWRIKIVIACLQTILRDESQTVGNSPQRFSSPTLNPTYVPFSSRFKFKVTLTSIFFYFSSHILKVEF